MRRQTGSILILTLWVLAVIALFSLAAGTQARQRLRYVQQFEIRSKLRVAADAGIKRAQAAVFAASRLPAHSLGDAWAHDEAAFKAVQLKETFYTVKSVSPIDGRESYGAVDEARKIDLNKTRSEKILAGIFEFGAGVPQTQAAEIAASILDWRDEDDVLNAGGAEAKYYRTLSPQYEPKNSQIDTLEELLLVKGVTPEILLRVFPYVTVDGESAVNLNTAPGPVLRACGLTPAMAEKVILFRNGRDKVPGTPDDRVFRSAATLAEDLKQAVSLNTDEEKSLKDFGESGLFDVKASSFSAASTASLQGRKEALTVLCYFSIDGAVRRCHETYGRLEEKSSEPGAFNV